LSTSSPTGNQIDTTDEPHRPYFVTTHWSVVLAAGRADTPNAQLALETLMPRLLESALRLGVFDNGNFKKPA
jgi:hypothetical protein